MGNIGHTLNAAKKDMRRRLSLLGEIAPHLADLDTTVISYFLNNRSQIPEALRRGFVIGDSKPTEKFALLVDLDIITVPDDYDHATAFGKFLKKNRKKFHHSVHHNNITDKDLPNPTRILRPGDKLRTRVFKQVALGATTSEERMVFLATQNAIHTGAQGMSLVFEQKRDQLPKGCWYGSFDEEDRLWRDVCGDRRVPHIYRYSNGDFEFRFSNFRNVWEDSYAFLCFTEVE